MDEASADHIAFQACAAAIAAHHGLDIADVARVMRQQPIPVGPLLECPAGWLALCIAAGEEIGGEEWASGPTIH